MDHGPWVQDNWGQECGCPYRCTAVAVAAAEYGSSQSDTCFSQQFVIVPTSSASLLFMETSVQPRMPQRDFFLAPEIATTVMSSCVTTALLWGTRLYSLLSWLPRLHPAVDSSRWPLGDLVCKDCRCLPPPQQLLSSQPLLHPWQLVLQSKASGKPFWTVSVSACGEAQAGAGCPKEQKILWAASCRQSQKQQLEGIGRVQGAAESWEGENTECGRARKDTKERWRLPRVKDCGLETAGGKRLQKAPGPSCCEF